MAEAEELCASLPSPRPWSAIGLVLNPRGLERAMDAALDEVNLVAYASDGYSRINTGAPADTRNRVAAELAAAARAAGLRVTVTIAVTFGDPVDGDVPKGSVGALAAEMTDAGAHEINLGDTIGVAVPELVAERIAEVRSAARGAALRCHFHDTNRTGYANVYAALGAGVDTLDASVGGYGGSPLHPGAGGNVATEHLVWMLERSGFETGMNRGRLVEAARWLSARLGDAQPAS
jgi:hydroxymethylglutaryl-CoA lyase